jgi:hypothetical protein
MLRPPWYPHAVASDAKKIKLNILDDMREALHDAAAYKRGDAVNLRVTKVPTRPKKSPTKKSAPTAAPKTPADPIAS